MNPFFKFWSKYDKYRLDKLPRKPYCCDNLSGRMALGYVAKPSVTKKETVDLLDSVINKYYIKGAIIRNDNGSQFIAGYTRDLKNILITILHLAII